MKKSTPLMLGLLSLGLVSGATTAVVTTNAFAAEDTATTTATATTSTTEDANAPVLTEEQQAMKTLHESAKAALESGDYSAWSQAMTTINETQYQNMKEAITEDSFATLQKIEAAREAGDYETARTLSQELDVPMMGMGMGHRGGPGFHGPRPEGAPEAPQNSTTTENQ